MAGDKGKRILIHLSSSSFSSSSDGSSSASASFSSGEEWESIDGEDEDRDVYEVDESEEADEEEEDEQSFENGRQGAEDDDDDDSLCNRVIQFLQVFFYRSEKNDLHKLSLKACKAYLRKHGLRVSGNKDACVKRVQEHWRIKDGNAEVIYPRSSFVINCRGDVCKGDIVLFTQKVYERFDKVMRNGKLMGQRTVAGRVIKESYGAVKQQHTFTVEVLWSKGVKKLPPLFPLLVKGRNLYRLKTYRQPWKNEAARSKVLGEKHRRGTVARMERAKRKKARSIHKGLLGGKSQKALPSIRQSQMNYSRRKKRDGRDQRASSSNHSAIKFDYQHSDVKHGAEAHVIEATCSGPFPRREEQIFPEDRASDLRLYHDLSHRYPQPLVESHQKGIFENEIPYHRPVILPEAQCNGFSSGPFCRDSCGTRLQWMSHADSWQFLPGQWHNGLFKCSIRGCNECGTDRCVIAACWRCCRRERMRCSVHR